MKQIGSFICLIGILAIVLHFINVVPRILIWIYKWGDGTAWMIKIGLVLVGAALYFLGSKRDIAR
jgi:hypothetical protein